MSIDGRWPRPCAYCRGYNLERRWCGHCNQIGYDTDDVKRFREEQFRKAPGVYTGHGKRDKQGWGQ